VVHVYDPSYSGDIGRIVVKASPLQKLKTQFKKITKSRKGWGLDSTGRIPVYKLETLSSSPSIPKEEKRENESE
jgi:hypothetical protein